MGIISIRLNAKEQKILNYLSKYFSEETSALLKHSLFDLYEDVIDRERIYQFEEDEKNGAIGFVAAEEILKAYKK
jgi:hypothetical protein